MRPEPHICLHAAPLLVPFFLHDWIDRVLLVGV